MIHACTMTSPPTTPPPGTSPPDRYRIIAVCTGNICRSPMAELMLAEAMAAAGLAGAVVDSAVTTAYEVGRPIDPRAARKLTAHSIPSDRHVAREWRAEWFQARDLILALDVDHFGWLQQAAPERNAGDTLTFSATGLPAGLSISASGLITGTPTTAGEIGRASCRERGFLDV